MNLTLMEIIYKTNISIFTFLFYISFVTLIAFFVCIKSFVNQFNESYIKFIGFSFLIIVMMTWVIRSYYRGLGLVL